MGDPWALQNNAGYHVPGKIYILWCGREFSRHAVREPVQNHSLKFSINTDYENGPISLSSEMGMNVLSLNSSGGAGAAAFYCLSRKRCLPHIVFPSGQTDL